METAGVPAPVRERPAFDTPTILWFFGAFTAAGRIISSCLPAGQVATAVHRGPYEDLLVAHQAVRA